MERGDKMGANCRSVKTLNTCIIKKGEGRGSGRLTPERYPRVNRPRPRPRRCVTEGVTPSGAQGPEPAAGSPDRQPAGSLPAQKFQEWVQSRARRIPQ